MIGSARDEPRFVRGLFSPAALLVALAIDQWIGEPPARVHPVVGVGRSISALERRAPEGPRREFVYGTAVAAGATFLPAVAVRSAVGAIRPWPLRLVAEVLLLKTCFAYRALEEAGLSVAEPLTAGDLPAAREKLRALVSRDRTNLDESQIAAATIESLAENLGDGFAAPLLAYALGGLPAAVFYRAANTADSMLGYRGRYEYLGKASARLDDVLNLAPARLTAVALVAASGPKASRTCRTLVRGRRLTQSPNAGWTISAVAGALGVALEKPGHYRINEGARDPDAQDIIAALRLCRRAAILCVAAVLTVTLLRGAFGGEKNQ